MEIYSVCWNITKNCNENCIFCYRTISSDLDLKNNIKIANKLINHDVKKITIAGGEPLLYKDLFKLVKYIKKQNKNIILSLTTNGMLINNSNIKKIIKYFDWISLSIESTEENYHELIGRGKNHFKKNLILLNKLNNKMNIKINTVATKLNHEEITHIYKLISNYNISRWKIFRYYPINYMAKENNKTLSISNNEYNKLKLKLNKLNNEKTEIEYNDIKDFKTSYFSIFSNGDLKNQNGKIVANILDETIDECINKLPLKTHSLRKILFEKAKNKNHYKK